MVPYVPTPALALLQRDTLTFESPRSYDGGPDGTDILRRVLTESPRYLRPGGTVLVELGGEEADALTATCPAWATSTSPCSSMMTTTSGARGHLVGLI